jgi:hypothetical protein
MRKWLDPEPEDGSCPPVLLRIRLANYILTSYIDTILSSCNDVSFVYSLSIYIYVSVLKLKSSLGCVSCVYPEYL